MCATGSFHAILSCLSQDSVLPCVEGDFCTEVSSVLLYEKCDGSYFGYKPERGLGIDESHANSDALFKPFLGDLCMTLTHEQEIC